MEKIFTKFEPSNQEDVINKSFLDKKLFKIEGHILYIENDHNEYKILSIKQSV